MTHTDLSDRLIVITGAARGLGLAMAHACVDAGARVIGVDRNAELLETAAASFTGSSTGSESFRGEVCDITDETAVGDLFDRLDEPLWGVVNNAALADGVGGLPFWEIDADAWRRIVGVNLDGTWLVSKYAAPAMIAQRQGRIVNLASDAALYGSPRLSHYIASKGAIIALTRAMARDLGDYEITVNAIAPGLTEGPSAETIPADRHQLYRDNRAIKRPQTPADICGLATYLLGDASSYVTGQTIVVDGGFVMG